MGSEAPHRTADVRVKSTVVAVGVGFAVVFGLWLLWGYQLMRSFQDIEQNISEVHESYVRGDRALVKVRTNVLLGSIYLRDALIDSASPRRDYYRGEMTRLRTEVEQMLREYLPVVVSPAEQRRWARLQTELADYWASREVAFSDESRSAAESAALLRSRIVPRRETILEIIDQLAALQRAAGRRHRVEAAARYRQARTRLLTVGGAILVVALVVALMVSRQVNRLQRHIARQRLAEQQHREDLERLSARLVGAQEDERRNLARELHDEVGQALTAVKMDIGIALRGDIEPRARDALQEARDIAENTLRGVRDLSQLLHPSTLDDFGLPATLTAYLRNFSQRTGMRAHLAETIDDRLVTVIEVCVYRIVQEALNNVAQHSSATACTVALGAGGGGVLRLVIDDNGRGLPPGTASTRRGLGLIGMRERAQALGGTFAIGECPGGGTRIAVSLPLEVTVEAVEEQAPRRVG